MIRLLAAVGLVAGLLGAGRGREHPHPLARPIVGRDVVFEEANGLLVVEAEHFLAQTKANTRAWLRTSTVEQPEIESDGDPSHAKDAGANAYVEVLPDTRRTHGDKLKAGENFSNDPGKMALLHYKAFFRTPGRYYVWVRAHSTGTEDNGIHVGLDGQWPEHGRRMQWTAKGKWFWDSKQRTQKVHTGVPGQVWLDVEKPGLHLISFSMREDGFEFDRFLMTTDAKFKRPEGIGPTVRVRSGKLPEPPPDAKDAKESAKPRRR